MKAADLFKKIREIEFKTKKKSKNIFSGAYHSTFKGQGMSFSENRAYQIGDEIRRIDWNVTAKLGNPYIKLFEEERELTLFVLLDVSASCFFGAKNLQKNQLIAEILAILGFASVRNKDRIGAIFFSDRIEKIIPAQKGHAHILQIIRACLQIDKPSEGTDLELAIKTLNNFTKKSATVFLLSDFMAADYEKSLSILSQKHDVFAIKINDPQEIDLPEIGYIRMQDAENKIWKWINTHDKKTKKAYKEQFLAHENYTEKLFRKRGIPLAKINTQQDYFPALLKLLQR